MRIRPHGFASSPDLCRFLDRAIGRGLLFGIRLQAVVSGRARPRLNPLSGLRRVPMADDSDHKRSKAHIHVAIAEMNGAAVRRIARL